MINLAIKLYAAYNIVHSVCFIAYIDHLLLYRPNAHQISANCFILSLWKFHINHSRTMSTKPVNIVRQNVGIRYLFDFPLKCSLKKVSINIFVEVRDRHNWGLFLVPDFLNTKPKRKLLFFCLLKYDLILLKSYNKIIHD